MPVALAARLRRSHFLFLGYEMADWNLRLILNRIWGERPVGYRSWAVQRAPSPLAQAFWRRFDVAALDVDPQSYVELLERRLEARVTGCAESPYKGLNAFEDSELDALLFFGRERETRDRGREPHRVAPDRPLRAERRREVVAPAGGSRALAARAARGTARRRLLELERRSERGARRGGARGRRRLVERLGRRGARARAGGARRLPRPRSGRGVLPLPRRRRRARLVRRGAPGACSATPSRVNVLVSLREDSLAKLDRFTGRIPGLFANTLRLDRLDRAGGARRDRPAGRALCRAHRRRRRGRAGARRARCSTRSAPARSSRRSAGSGRSRARSRRADRGAVSPARHAAALGGGARGGIDVLCARRRSTRLGGAQHIVEEHLEGAMAELTRGAEGRRGADLQPPGHAVGDEDRPRGLGPRRLRRRACGGGRAGAGDARRSAASCAPSTRAATRYEIFHDVLAEPVLAWRAEHEADASSRRRRRGPSDDSGRLLVVIAVGAVLLAAMGAVTVYALTQRDRGARAGARGQGERARRECRRRARARPGAQPPARARGGATVPSESLRAALRRALLESRVRASSSR